MNMLLLNLFKCALQWLYKLLGISGVAFAKYFLRHAWRKNSVSKARKNIPEHYDLVSELSLYF